MEAALASAPLPGKPLASAASAPVEGLPEVPGGPERPERPQGFLDDEPPARVWQAPHTESDKNEAWSEDHRAYEQTQQDEAQDHVLPSTPVPVQASKQAAIPSLQDAKAPRPQLGMPTLSPEAIRSRSKRIFTPRANGSLKVSQAIYDEWHKKGQERKNLEMIFQQCGYDPD